MPKRLEKEPDTSFPSSILYREDLDDILGKARAIAKDQVWITDREYSYESIDDLRKTRGTVVKELTIRCSEPHYFTFTIQRAAHAPMPVIRSLRYVHLSGSSEEARALCDHIKSILSDTRREWIGRVFNRAFVVPLYVLAGVTWILALALPYKAVFWSLSVVLCVLGGLAGLMSHLDADGAFSYILLRRRAEPSAGFFTQYRNQIILVVTSAVLTFAVTKGCDYVWDSIGSDQETHAVP